MAERDRVWVLVLTTPIDTDDGFDLCVGVGAFDSITTAEHMLRDVTFPNAIVSMMMTTNEQGETGYEIIVDGKAMGVLRHTRIVQ